MIRRIRGIIAGLGLAAVMTAPASATSWGGNSPPVWCGGDGFSTCFSVNMSWTAVTGTTLAVTLQLKNENPTPGLKWFSIGLDNLSLGSVTLSSYTVTGPSGWAPPGPQDFNGAPFGDPTASSTYSGGENPIPAGYRTWTFTLTMDGSLTAAQWDQMLQAASVGIHAGGLDPCPSTKVDLQKNGSTYSTNSGPPSECDQPSPPQEIVPEPATLSLMAIGLVGLAGAGAIRRRNKKV